MKANNAMYYIAKYTAKDTDTDTYAVAVAVEVADTDTYISIVSLCLGGSLSALFVWVIALRWQIKMNISFSGCRVVGLSSCVCINNNCNNTDGIVLSCNNHQTVDI